MSIDLFKTDVSQESIDNVVDVLRSGWLGLGKKTAEFEKEFSNYVGSQYCLGLNSCTSALHLAVKALGLVSGDEVITTPMTFVSTNEVLLYEGIRPVFVDIEYGTLNIDVNKIIKAITQKTKAIMCVHFAGQPCDLDEIYKIAHDNNLYVIEDASHAAGASYKGKKIGFGDLVCWSFQAVKNLPVGDGGAITTNNIDYYNYIKKLRWLGIDKSTYERSNVGSYSWRYDVDTVGYKYHMNDVTAAIGIGQLNALDKNNSKRKYIVDYYINHIDNPLVVLPQFKPDRISSNHIFHIKIDDRDSLLHKLRDNDIYCGVHYYPNHLYSIFNGNFDLPVTEEVYTKILSLPVHTLLAEADLAKVCKVINEFRGW
jgi:perosamine synthetase